MNQVREGTGKKEEEGDKRRGAGGEGGVRGEGEGEEQRVESDEGETRDLEKSIVPKTNTHTHTQPEGWIEGGKREGETAEDWKRNRKGDTQRDR